MENRVVRALCVIGASAFLASCSGSRESRAADACETAAKARAEGKMLAVDHGALEKSAIAEGTDQLRLRAPVTFDTGLQSQYTQTLDCRVRFVDGKAEVLTITFVF